MQIKDKIMYMTVDEALKLELEFVLIGDYMSAIKLRRMWTKQTFQEAKRLVDKRFGARITLPGGQIKIPLKSVK